MTPSDVAAWVQTLGSIAAIVVAIWVPWKIHQNEQLAARRGKDSYRLLLPEAFADVEGDSEAPESVTKTERKQALVGSPAHA
jgi:hypothetical protein